MLTLGRAEGSAFFGAGADGVAVRQEMQSVPSHMQPARLQHVMSLQLTVDKHVIRQLYFLQIGLQNQM